MGSMVAYGLLCALAVFSAYLVRKDERGALTASLAIFAGWAMFVASWSDKYSPADLFPFLLYTERWAMTDLVIATTILFIAGLRWWGLALAGILWVQVLFHVAHQYTGLEFEIYSVALDVLFLGQLAILFTLGGGRLLRLLKDLKFMIAAALARISTSPALSFPRLFDIKVFRD